MQTKEPEGQKAPPEGTVNDALQGIFSWLGTFFKGIFAAAEPVLVADLKKFYATWEPAALAAVEAEASKTIAGTEKMSNAITNLTGQLQTSGWTVASGIIQTLLQDAYLVFQAKLGTIQIKAP